MARTVELPGIIKFLEILIKFRYVGLILFVVLTDVRLAGTPKYTEKLPELEYYASKFYRLSKYYLPKGKKIKPREAIHIEFNDLYGDKVGRCSYFNVYGKTARLTITIDRKFWERADKTYKEIVMFHELGHCALGRKHNDETTPIGPFIDIGNSIMNSYVDMVPGGFYLDNRDEYLRELFSGD